MKKKLLLLWAIAVFAVASAFTQNSQTIHVTTPGTLSTLVTNASSITDLVVTGTIDSSDLAFISHNMFSSLATLDLGGSEIVGNRIPMAVFVRFDKLTTFIAPPTVTTIGDGAFMFCSILKSVTLPQSLINIEKNAFFSCTSLKEIILPPALKTIGYTAFYSCDSLTEINIPASLISLDLSFADCKGISTFHVDESSPYFCSFEDVLFNKDKTTLYCYPAAHERTNYAIPGSVDTLLSAAFDFCKNLATLTIPASLKSIGYAPFYRANLSSILVDDANTIFSDADGVLFNKDFTTLIVFPSNKAVSYVVPDGVKVIDDNAFYHNQKITSIKFNNELTSIGNSAFSNCSALNTPKLPPSLISIKMSAFNSCGNFTSMTFLPPLDAISFYVVSSCTSMVSLTIPSTVTYMSSTNLFNCTNIDSVKINAAEPISVEPNFYYSGIDTTNCTIYVPSGSLNTYKNAPFWRAFDIEEFDFSLLTSGNEFTVGATAGSDTAFTITSNTEWSLESDQNWLHMDRPLGIDSDSIVISADANPSGNSREATVTVTGLGTDPVTITVTQAAGPTAIKHTDDSGIGVYPNPVTDKLFIIGCAGVRAEIYNLTGSLVLSKALVDETETIDMKSLAAGTYLLKLDDHHYKISK